MPPEPPPEAYIKAADRVLARRRDPSAIPCTVQKREGGVEVIASLPTDQCFRMLRPARMTGVWIDEFEGSQFFPNMTRAPSHYNGPRIWLDTERVRMVHGYESTARNGRAVLVDFIGRRTQYRGASGHLGMFDYEVIIDRLISSRSLP